MALLLAALAVDDTEEQWGDAVVTLTTWRERQLWPEGCRDTGERALMRWTTKRMLVPYSLLWVQMHKTQEVGGCSDVRKEA
jgi:hypothetical protein